MIKIKIKNLSTESNVYRIKLDNQLIDSDVVDNDVMELQYALPFSDTKTHYMSISFIKGDCPFIVQEIKLGESKQIAKNENGIPSAICSDITKMMNHNYSDTRASVEIGGNKEWVFLVENNDQLVFWNGDNNSFSDHGMLDIPEPLNGNYTFDFSDGRIYEGYFINNKMHGEGTITFASGKISSISGYFDENEDIANINDVIYRNGDTLKIVEGSLNINLKNCTTIDPKEISVPGTQCYTWYDDTVDFKDTYTGDFINGELDGQGSLSFKNPSPYLKYEGAFVDGDWEGYGTLYYRNGDVLEGAWESGQKGKCEGTIEFKSGPYYRYVGWFENNIPYGQGRLDYRNGDVFHGNVIKGSPDFETYGEMNFTSGEILAVYGSIFDAVTGETANSSTSIIYKDLSWLTTMDSVNIKDISLKRFNCTGNYYYLDKEFLVAVRGVWEEGKINLNHDVEVFYYDNVDDKLKSDLVQVLTENGSFYVLRWGYPIPEWFMKKIVPVIRIVNNRITYYSKHCDRPINIEEFIAHNQYLDSSIDHVYSGNITDDDGDCLLYQPK